MPVVSDWFSGSWMSLGIPGYDEDLDIELDDMDLYLLDTYNTNVPFQCDLTPHGHTIQSTGAAYPDITAGIGNEQTTSGFGTFEDVYWRFRPNVHDHHSAEEHNLSLPSVEAHNPSPESNITLRRRVTSTRLSAAARDRIIAMIIQSCSPSNLPRAMASFPSVELLDTLLQFYLTSPTARAVSFLHVPTFDPNKKKPELVAAMAACGAILTSDPTFVKLGYAIQECVRKSTAALVSTPY